MSASALTRPQLLQRGVLLEYLTVGWNLVEGIIAVAAAVLAGSPALMAFGVDSFVESVSGVVLIWRLRSELHGDLDDVAVDRIEDRARRLVGVAFLLLAAFVTFEAVRTLAAQERPDASPVGIVLTLVSILVMVWLARAKRRTGEALDSPALIADSRQTAACWYLSVAALIGLGLNALLGLWWADPVAALVIVLFLVREGAEAIRGEGYADEPSS